MTHPNKSALTPRSRRFKLAAAASAIAVVSGTAVVALTASPAQAATQNFALYSQISTFFQGTPTNEGTQNIGLTVTPASTTAGTPIEVRVSSSTFNINNGPSAAAAGAIELDAVITLNGTDYALRGSQNTSAVAANSTVFAAGWVVSSTAGNSTGGTSGIGAALRSAPATTVSLVAPATGTYPITLKALVANAITGTSTVALTNNFDAVFNTALATITAPGATNNGPKNTFNNNVSSSYLTYSPTVNLTVT